MVEKINEAAEYDHRRRLLAGEGNDPPRVSGKPRDGKTLWRKLRPRVLSLVRMRSQWGDVHDIYDSTLESRYESLALPRTHVLL